MFQKWRLQYKIWIEIIQTVLSIAFTIMFILENYAILDKRKVIVYDIIDFCLCLLFIIIFLIDFFIEKNIAYLYRLESILDYISVLPIFIFVILSLFQVKTNVNLQFLQFIRILRLFRLFILFFNIQRISVWSSVRSTIKKIIVLILTILTLILLFSSIFQAVENAFRDKEFLYFHDSVYLICVTLLTIGYGDVVPRSVLGKACIIIFVVIGLMIIPFQAGKLYQLLMSGKKIYHELIDLNLNNHIIIGGISNLEDIINFTNELFSLLNQETKIVLTFDQLELNQRFSSFNYQNRIICHSCDLKDFNELELLNIKKCKTIFLLNSHKIKDKLIQDQKLFMIHLALINYYSKINVHSQMNTKFYKEKLNDLGFTNVICIDELKMKLLNQSLHVNGFTTFLNNLFSSNSILSDQFTENYQWKNEYKLGLNYGIYKIPISSQFNNILFSKFALLCYKKFELFIFGIEREKEIHLNPNFNIQSDSDYALLFSKSYLKTNPICSFKELKFDIDFNLTFPKENTVLFSKVIYVKDKFEYKDHILILGDLNYIKRKNEKQMILFMNYFNDESQEYKQFCEKFKDFNNIYYIQGDLKDKKSLERANIKNASQVLLLSNSELSDDSNIESGLLIKSLNDNFIIELINQSSIKYFTNGELNLIFSSLFASGKLFSFSNLFDKLLCQSYFNNSLIQIFNLFCDSIEIINLPLSLNGKYFNQCFEYFLIHKNSIIFAIFRFKYHSDNDHSYIITCPNENLLLNEKDQLFILKK